ncbi:hypothetical protein EST38_g11211 [Candolleomyces aberdarensis]|uniref:HMG domain-containing protein n=1 Tax=Candolleomyces aberdarensis TaxID=2316362 RepID=A0A4Q2D870_9AGAR|nr:hypothetical protein EST38_g11211 [Candolleomyces aberdarensis]
MDFGDTVSPSLPQGPLDDVTSEDSQLTAYAEMVDASVAVFQHIGDGVFVVQGWDARRKQLTTSWFHLQCLQLENDVGVACTCPNGIQEGRCVHSELFQIYETESMLQQKPLTDYGDPRASIFSRQLVPNTSDVLTMFSVKSISSSALKGCAIVQHSGTLPWKGTWKCSKEPGNPGCPHIKIAFEVLREELRKIYGKVDDDTEFDPTMFSGESMVGGQGLARRRFIGPDLREVGLFNFNNSFIVSHELLDEYTMSYVTSETPFVAWCSVVAHRYLLSGSQFMSDGYFLPIWFSYAALLALNDDMCCLRCGTYPETTIWDGITLAFGKKHLAATLRPPTKTSPSASITRKNIKHRPRQQLIEDEGLRAQLRLAVQVPSIDGASKPPSHPQHVTKREVLDHVERIQWVYQELDKVCKTLAALFQKAYGAVVYSERRRAPSNLDSFFKQIAAEESVLQMVNGAALVDLTDFLADPRPSRVTKVLSIPGLYKILRNGPEMQGFVLPISDLTPMLQWLADRATQVLGELSVESDRLPDGVALAEEPDWKVAALTACHNYDIVLFTPS